MSIAVFRIQVVSQNGYDQTPSLGLATTNDESGVPTKRAAVTFKIPDCDDRSGKGMGDIMAGKIITALTLSQKYIDNNFKLGLLNY